MKLNILTYPDERLTTVARPVARVDERVRRLVADMFETMHAADGVGLAATQVDTHEQIIVIHLRDDGSVPLVFINPELLWKSDERCTSEEGCLSVPGYYDDVERARSVRVRALNEKGEMFELKAEGRLAVCLQHEMDHLQGKVFVDTLSWLKRSRLRTKFLKRARQA